MRVEDFGMLVVREEPVMVGGVRGGGGRGVGEDSEGSEHQAQWGVDEWVERRLMESFNGMFSSRRDALLRPLRRTGVVSGLEGFQTQPVGATVVVHDDTRGVVENALMRLDVREVVDIEEGAIVTRESGEGGVVVSQPDTEGARNHAFQQLALLGNGGNVMQGLSGEGSRWGGEGLVQGDMVGCKRRLEAHYVDGMLKPHPWLEEEGSGEEPVSGLSSKGSKVRRVGDGSVVDGFASGGGGWDTVSGSYGRLVPVSAVAGFKGFSGTLHVGQDVGITRLASPIGQLQVTDGISSQSGVVRLLDEPISGFAVGSVQEGSVCGSLVRKRGRPRSIVKKLVVERGRGWRGGSSVNESARPAAQARRDQ